MKGMNSYTCVGIMPRGGNRALTKKQKGAKTLKQKKKDMHSQMHRYAFRALIIYKECM